MVRQQFQYGTGSIPTVFTPTWPAKGRQPVDELVATKSDSITSAGQKQSVVERIDSMQDLNFPVVPVGELSDWQAMVIFGMDGGVISYYPDSTSGTHEDFYLEDTDWNPKFVSPGFYTFTIKLRKVVT
jgi:hypothetical protein